MRDMKNKTFLIGIVIILAAFVVLMCWGCSRRSGPAPTPENAAGTVAQPFDAKATIRMKDLVMTADINKTAANQLTLKVNEPATLQGMAFQYDGQNITVSYRGLSVKLDGDSKLVSSIASIIVNSIDKASSPSGVDVRIDGGALILSGQSDSGRFELALDRKNGSMASLSVPELDFECHFDDFLFQK